MKKGNVDCDVASEFCDAVERDDFGVDVGIEFGNISEGQRGASPQSGGLYDGAIIVASVRRCYVQEREMYGSNENPGPGSTARREEGRQTYRICRLTSAINSPPSLDH